MDMELFLVTVFIRQGYMLIMCLFLFPPTYDRRL